MAITKASPIRVLIAEDHFIARVGVGTILNLQPDMEVVAEATNGRQAVALYKEHRPDIALIDMRMPVLNGFDAVTEIRAEFPEARIIALSTYCGDEDIHQAFLAGVHCYLTKDVLHNELVQAIRTVHSGQRYVLPVVQAALAAQSGRIDLSVREVEVLGLIVRGLSNKEIASVLNIAEHTVKNHVKHIFGKLEVDDRTRAATVAIDRGIVHLRD